MVDVVGDNPPEQVRGRPFAKGRSGNPAGRRLGSRNKATVAAQELLANEAEALTRKAVEAALAGDPMAMRLCLERILPRERVVKFALPPIKSAADVAPAMGAVTAALADGLISPGEAQAIARVVTTFVQMIETSDFDRRLRMLEAGQPDAPSSQLTIWPYSGPYNLKTSSRCRPAAGATGCHIRDNRKWQHLAGAKARGTTKGAAAAGEPSECA